MDYKPFLKILPHLIGAVVLIFILLFVLANFGYIRPCDIPGFNDIYYSIKGYPNVAIVYGESGMGDPDVLRGVIIERTHIFPAMFPIENVLTGGVLDKYELVIVERAKKIPTATLTALRDYVQKGGKLVWVGDAGTELGDEDYICYPVEFGYAPQFEVTAPPAEEGGEPVVSTQCGEWVYEKINDPKTLNSGLCGKTFADVVYNFTSINKTIYDDTTTGGVSLCDSVDDPFQINGADKILSCLSYFESKSGKTVSDIGTASFSKKQFKDWVTANCTYSPGKFMYGINYWNRGASELKTGTITKPFDFSSNVLGLDFVSDFYVDKSQTELFLQPVDPNHRLVRGYNLRTNVAVWFGNSTFSIVDASRFTVRSSSVYNLKLGDEVYPAIVVSSPVGPLVTKTGLIIYYAFPPEIGAREDRFAGSGLNLINNLIDFALCK